MKTADQLFVTPCYAHVTAVTGDLARYAHVTPRYAQFTPCYAIYVAIQCYGLLRLVTPCYAFVTACYAICNKGP